MDLSKWVSDGLAICGESHAFRLHYIPIFKANKYSTISTGKAWRLERDTHRTWKGVEESSCVISDCKALTKFESWRALRALRKIGVTLGILLLLYRLFFLLAELWKHNKFSNRTIQFSLSLFVTPLLFFLFFFSFFLFSSLGFYFSIIISWIIYNLHYRNLGPFQFFLSNVEYYFDMRHSNYAMYLSSYIISKKIFIYLYMFYDIIWCIFYRLIFCGNVFEFQISYLKK